MQLWSKENGRSIFPRIMTRNRFSMLTSYLRFDDRETRLQRRESDKLAPFRDFWNKFIARCRGNYCPNVHTTVDEMLVTFRGRCPFKMFIPSKPGRYGIKIWVLADSDTKYCYNADIYIGRTGNVREVNQAARVVLELSEPLSGSGRNIVGDNFFSSLHLVRCLEQRQLTYFGTIRKNKPELPCAFQLTRDREVGSSVFGFHEKVMAVSYVPKRNKVVNLISSLHLIKEISEDRGKPTMILDYNRLKCGVDTLDQVVRKYSCKRRTLRWPMALFYNSLDIAAYNSYIVFLHMNPSWNQRKCHRRRLFLIQLARSLAGIPHEELDGILPQLQQLPKSRGRCRLCGWEKDRKASVYCDSCGHAVCKDHFVKVCAACKR